MSPTFCDDQTSLRMARKCENNPSTPSELLGCSGESWVVIMPLVARWGAASNAVSNLLNANIELPEHDARLRVAYKELADAERELITTRTGTVAGAMRKLDVVNWMMGDLEAVERAQELLESAMEDLRSADSALILPLSTLAIPALPSMMQEPALLPS
jgi:hypothetical protein